MLTLRTLFAFGLALLLTVQPAFAWSECGHQINALLAYDRMKPDQQTRVLELLKHHPRYTQDFAAPKSAKTPEQMAHWQSSPNVRTREVKALLVILRSRRSFSKGSASRPECYLGAKCCSRPHFGQRKAMIGIIKLPSSLSSPKRVLSVPGPGCQWLRMVVA